MLEIMWSVAFLTSGVFLCHPVSYEFSKGLTADFSFSLLHVGVKVGGNHEVSLKNAARVPQSLDNPARDDRSCDLSPQLRLTLFVKYVEKSYTHFFPVKHPAVYR